MVAFVSRSEPWLVILITVGDVVLEVGEDVPSTAAMAFVAEKHTIPGSSKRRPRPLHNLRRASAKHRLEGLGNRRAFFRFRGWNCPATLSGRKGQ